MITAIKIFLKGALIPTLYFGGYIVALYSMFKRPIWGIFLITALIPLPNLWQQFYQYPLGKDFMDIVFVCIFVGIFVTQKSFQKGENGGLIILFILYSYLSLWNTSLAYPVPLPISGANWFLLEWKNYAQMILLYFLAFNIIKDEEDQKKIVIMIVVVLLLISIKEFRNFSGGASFSYARRSLGPFFAVGLGANHFGAFVSHYGCLALGLFLLDDNKKRRILYITTYLFSLHPLLFSYSRGAYLASGAIVGLFGILKKRILLVLLIIFTVAWEMVLPASVVDRVSMTTSSDGQIESSAAHRFVMWDIAISLFKENPVIGAGWGAYGLNVPEEEELKDTHNYYLRVTCEQGIIGIGLLLFLLVKANLSGFKLFRKDKKPFFKSLGFGFLGCSAALMITNLFGDRFSYFVLGSYFFILWGVVDRRLYNNRTAED